jgi:hypothetical protein
VIVDQVDRARGGEGLGAVAAGARGPAGAQDLREGIAIVGGGEAVARIRLAKWALSVTKRKT